VLVIDVFILTDVITPAGVKDEQANWLYCKKATYFRVNYLNQPGNWFV